MSLAFLEFNDQSLLIQAEDGPLHSQPGFARLSPEGIETGETARASAWREPQHSYNQYWCQLNQAALAAKQGWARHHADIAFAQIRSLWQTADSPDSLLVLVPGSFDDSQLSLLLGMLEALPAKTIAVIDSALAACFEADRETLFVELQLHQTVLTLCRPQGRKVSVINQEVFPDLGLMQIYNSVARHISSLLIDSNRYDPLHASDSEQTIFDRLPDWLARLRWEKEVSASIDSEHGQLPFFLRSEVVKALVSERMGNVRSFLGRHPDSHLVLSHGSALLTGLSDEFSNAELSDQSAGIDHCHAHLAVITDQLDSLYRVQELQRSAAHQVPDSPVEKLATHVLYGDQAMSLHMPVSIRINGDGLEFVNAVDKNAAFTVVLRNRNLEVVHSDPDLETSIPRNCKPGDFIRVGEHQLRLIEVHNG